MAAGTGLIPLVAGLAGVIIVLLFVLHLATGSGLGTAVSSADLEKTLGAFKKPVVVDFYADWCGPCQSQGPILDSVSDAYGSRVKFVRVNVDQYPALSRKYGVCAIPALMIFKGGFRAWRTVGLTDEVTLRAAIDKVVASR
jgi:thioredoxin 1